MTTMKKFRWFWAWDDEKEESWLRQMSLKGWHFQSVGFPGSYTFAQGTPVDYIYRLDYFTDRKDMDNYLQLFQDAGWHYNGEMNGWQYFRKETVNGETQDIYSDDESKAKKFQRLLLFLVILLPVYISFIVILNRRSDGFMQALTFLMFLFLLFQIYATMMLLHRIMQLRKKM